MRFSTERLCSSLEEGLYLSPLGLSSFDVANLGHEFVSIHPFFDAFGVFATPARCFQSVLARFKGWVDSRRRSDDDPMGHADVKIAFRADRDSVGSE